jgi:hypothetical protein
MFIDRESKIERLMMQMTEAAFQVQANLKKQATDPMSHTPSEKVYQIKRCPAIC